MKSKFITALLFLFCFNVSFSQTPRVDVTIVSHNEEDSVYVTNPGFYYLNREYVRQLAVVIRNNNATWNIQSDWTFLRGVARYDTGSVLNSTNGKNILRWLVEDMGFEADPHAHESRYNYADVAYLHTAVAVIPSKNVGGFLYYPPVNPQGWMQHENGTYGINYPSYFWKPDNLWGAGTYLHQGPDDRSYGMWKPQDSANFYLHDSTKNLAYIGGGCYNEIGNLIRISGVIRILDAIQNHQVPDSGFYTVSIFVAQATLNSTVINNVSNALTQLAPYVSQGRLEWSKLTNTASLWRTNYNKKPFRIDCTALPTGIEPVSSEIPSSFELRQNYPNPFNPTTTIRFSLPQRTYATLKVFDVLGREVATLVEEKLNPGEHSVVFNAKGLASGVYCYRLQTGSVVQEKAMVLLK